MSNGPLLSSDQRIVPEERFNGDKLVVLVIGDDAPVSINDGHRNLNEVIPRVVNGLRSTQSYGRTMRLGPATGPQTPVHGCGA